MTFDPSAEKSTLSRRQVRALFLLFLVAFGIRLAFLLITPNNTTDSWGRFQDAEAWLKNPAALPRATSEGPWLPLHFWLLGSLLWLTKSEMSLRVFTALLGALTVVFCWGIFRRAFDPRIAWLSAVLLAVFGFHVTFSITTGSEVPTIFFLAGGVYCWLRYSSEGRVVWVLLSAVMFSTACLCRFEAWLYVPVLALMTFDSSPGWLAALSDQSRLKRVLGFGLLASGGELGWLLFSFLRWRDALKLPHRTAHMNLLWAIHRGTAFRLFVVPASLVTSLSPLILVLAALGLLLVLMKPLRPARSLAVLALTLFAFNVYSSVRYAASQPRYTVLYSWLLFPFAWEALRWLAEHWRRMEFSVAVAGTLIFFVLWQVGIIFGAVYAPPVIADRLAGMSPTIPFQHDTRGLINWLLQNDHHSSTIILDDFYFSSWPILRFAPLDRSQTFYINSLTYYSDRNLLRHDLDEFVRARHPLLCICSPNGLIGTMWSVGDAQDVSVENPAIHLHVLWRSEHWRVYSIADRVDGKSTQKSIVDH